MLSALFLFSGNLLGEVTGLANSMTFVNMLTRAQVGKTYECRYWKTSALQWTTDGMTTVGQTATEVKCSSNHLTTFSVFAVAGR